MVTLVVIAGRAGRAVTMPVRRDPRTGGWFFRTTIKTPTGKKLRLYGTPGVPGPYHDLAATKVGAQAAEQRAIKHALTGETGAAAAPEKQKDEVPTFHDWFKGRFWREWVVGRRNKPTEVKSKEFIYEGHLKKAFGERRLDEIGPGEIASFRASLVEKGLSEKRINNILAVLSKPMKYAVDCELIDKPPRIGLYKVERPRDRAVGLRAVRSSPCGSEGRGFRLVRGGLPRW